MSHINTNISNVSMDYFLAKTADTAAKTLKALDKFTGSQLAAAFGKDMASDRGAEHAEKDNKKHSDWFNS